MKPSPVALFAYTRAEHLCSTVESLSRNTIAKETVLYVFSDGPRTAQDEGKVEAVRNYVREIKGFADVNLVTSDQNRGLSASIVGGVDRVLAKHESLIVLEDDLATSPFFLQYMNDALRCYQDDQRVVSVHGYMYPVDGSLPETFFIRGADCWGWATWRRGWKVFNSDGRALLREIKRRRLTRSFNLNGAFNYLQILQDQVVGRNDSWAIRWHAAAFLADMVTLYPGRSLVQNLGTDGSGTHFKASSNQFDTEISNSPVDVRKIEAVEDEEVVGRLSAYYRKSKGGFLPRVCRRIARILRQDIPDALRLSRSTNNSVDRR
jgi:hypothetical protein